MENIEDSSTATYTMAYECDTCFLTEMIECDEKNLYCRETPRECAYCSQHPNIKEPWKKIALLERRLEVMNKTHPRRFPTTIRLLWECVHELIPQEND